MCNLYSMTRTQEAMRQLFQGLGDHTGNLAPLTEIYPDQKAPFVRSGPSGPEMVMGRWGMPTPSQFLIGKKTDRGVTNIRNSASPHWRQWAATSHRCLVPFTRFAEPDQAKGGNAWFHFPDERPSFFPGLWTRWTSVRKLKEGETTDDLFAFLTTEPNPTVAARHPKAMPVILSTPEAWQIWLSATWPEALRLQRPYPDDDLVVIEE
jgi:putative SOS response-associated peptidase YedK